MKKALTIFCLLFALSQTSNAQKENDPIFYLIKEKNRIDKLDGKLDGRLKLADSSRTALANKIYFTTVDSIWRLMLKVDVNEGQRDSIAYYLYYTLTRVRNLNVNALDKDNREITNILHILDGIYKNDLFSALKTNILISIKQVSLYSFRPETEPFLLYAATNYPEEVVENYHQYWDRPYRNKIVERVGKVAPNEMKKYVLEGNPINKIFKESKDPAVQQILKITENLGKRTQAYVLMDPIVRGEMTLASADFTTQKPVTFLKKMIQIRMQKDPIGEFSLEKELEIQSLKFVRNLNELHNEPDSKRFASIDNFTPEQLYTLIVYSEEEVFTSSFNGLLKRFLTKMGKTNGLTFLKSVGMNRYRTFIKQCASFGKLNEFMATMTVDDQKALLKMFVCGLDDANTSIDQAVEVADTYTGISDETLLTFIRKNIREEYKRSQQTKSREGMAIYGLLTSLFNSGREFNEDWYENISEKYGIPDITMLKNATLFQQNKESVWHMYFYDDEDGGASFKSFMNTFADKNWAVKEEDSLHVVIRSVNGQPVVIYANKPKAEYEGQAYLERILDSAGIQPDVLIHRGHSYYASKTIEKIKPSAKLFVLGSCGGYHNLSGVIQRAPEAHIISSKQIGVQGVNNPMLKRIADAVREGRDVEWAQIWSDLDKQLKGSESYIRFVDYIPPHKNVGAVFIRSYMKLTGAIQ
ncbi:MAG: hypothetical protein JNL95_00735 [Chitinophagales bacterium]|nr:hypothetical protein [Chitinophagales bacterium]